MFHSFLLHCSDCLPRFSNKVHFIKPQQRKKIENVYKVIYFEPINSEWLFIAYLIQHFFTLIYLWFGVWVISIFFRRLFRASVTNFIEFIKYINNLSFNFYCKLFSDTEAVSVFLYFAFSLGQDNYSIHFSRMTSNGFEKTNKFNLYSILLLALNIRRPKKIKSCFIQTIRQRNETRGICAVFLRKKQYMTGEQRDHTKKAFDGKINQGSGILIDIRID